MGNVATIQNHQDEQVLEISASQPMRLMEIAIGKGADLASLEKLMDLQERWEAGLAKKEFFSALSSFQSDIPVIPKNGKASFDHKNGGGSTEYTYALLDDICQAIRPILTNHGLSYRFEQKTEDQKTTVYCIISHASGHQERTLMSGFPDQSGKKNPIQQLASTVSYLRRYTLTGALGITSSDIDDDGQSSLRSESKPRQQDKNYYPEAAFQKNLPTWRKSIESGKKSSNTIIGFINKKGFSFTDDQLNQISQIGN